MKQLFSIIVILLFISQAFAQRVVVDSAPTLQDKFGKKAGSLRFSTMTLRIGKIMNNEMRSDTIRIYNTSARTLNLSPGKVPAFIEVKLNSPDIAPKAESWMVIKYDAAKRNDLGFVLDRFEILTNDSVQPNKAINVSANITEYFPPMTADDSLNVQKGRWIETIYDYGKINQGNKVTHKFSVINDGKRDLVIRKSKTTCNCIKNTISKNTIAPGDTSFITVDFDSKNKLGKDTGKLNIFLNDPAMSEVTLELKGEIIK